MSRDKNWNKNSLLKEGSVSPNHEILPEDLMLNKYPILSGSGSEKYEKLDIESEIEQAILDGCCTFQVTQKSYVLQKFYNCHQCELTESMGMCSSCANICHEGHVGVEEKKNSPSRAYCDCATILSENCLCLKKKPKSDEIPVTKPDSSYTGMGIYYFRNGDTYRGEFIKGKMHGKGTLRSKKRGFEIYRGDFCENRMEGTGVFEIDGTNNIYEGEVIDGKPSGRGSHYHLIGEEEERKNTKQMVYNGEFLNGKYHGQGALFFDQNEMDNKNMVKFKYEGSWDSGDRNGKGKSFFRNGNVEYEGDWKMSEKHGSGKQYEESSTKNGTFLVYDGEFRAGERTGFGKLYNNNNRLIYSGEWKNGKKNGRGKLFNNNQDQEKNIIMYDGSFVDDEKHGQGVWNFEDGERYVGGIHMNMKHGKGKYYYSDHEMMYEGGYKFDKYDGVGKLWGRHRSISTHQQKEEENSSKCPKEEEEEETNLFFYDGNFKDGKFDGVGNLFYPSSVMKKSISIRLSGNVSQQWKIHYSGYWKNGKRNGKGRNVWKMDGNYYYGDWINDLRHGVGKYCLEDGTVIMSGNWEEDVLEGEDGMKKYQSGETYHGSFHNGVRHGTGMLFRNTGELYYEGYFSQGKKHGMGKTYYPGSKGSEKILYHGSYANNLRDGMGECFSRKDESSYSGMWKSGSRCGKGRYTFRMANGKKTYEVRDGDWKDNKEHGVVLISKRTTRFIKNLDESSSYVSEDLSKISKTRIIGREVYFYGKLIRNISSLRTTTTKGKKYDIHLKKKRKKNLLKNYSLKYANSNELEDKDFLASILRYDGRQLKYLDKKKLGLDIVRAAISSYTESIMIVPKEFREDKKLVKLIIRENGGCLSFVNPKFLENVDIVSLALEQNGMNLELVHPKMQIAHPRLVKKAVQQNGLALKFCKLDNTMESEEMFHFYVSQIVTVAVRNNPFAVRYFQPAPQFKSMMSELCNQVILESFSQMNEKIKNHFELYNRPNNKNEDNRSNASKLILRNMIEDFFECLMVSQISWFDWFEKDRVVKKYLSTDLDCSSSSTTSRNIISNIGIQEIIESVKKLLYSSSIYLSDAKSYLTSIDEELMMIGISFSELIQSILDRIFGIHPFPNLHHNQVFLGCIFDSDFNVSKFSIDSSRKGEIIEEQEGEEEEKERLKCYGYGIVFDKISNVLKKTKFRRTFTGCFKNGLKNGKGTEYSKKGEILFEGQYSNDLKHGKGIEFGSINISNSKNKNKKTSSMVMTISKYEGMYIRGQKEGRGEMYDPKTGVVVRGFWKNNELDRSTISNTFNCPILEYRDYEEHLKNSSLLGSGANGNVYEVDASIFPVDELGIPPDVSMVAVKIMKCRNPAEVNLLFSITKRGIGLCCILESDYIIRVFGIIRGITEVGYVMERCNTDVGSLIKDSKLSLGLEEKIKIIYGTARGMRDLHDKLIMHRDLKWPNVMISSEGNVKITDFDTLKEDERKWRLFSIPGSSRIGTTGFVAPEVFLPGKKYTLKCDVYAFGLMIYSLLWGIAGVPHLTQFQCNCGMLLENIMSSRNLDTHVAHCNLRPSLNQSEMQKYPKYLMDIMVSSWDQDPYKRPSFKDIIQILESEEKKNKCYAILQLQFISIPIIIQQQQQKEEEEDLTNICLEDQIMLLVQPRISRIVEWIEGKFTSFRVKSLVYKNTGENLESDDQIYDIVFSNQKTKSNTAQQQNKKNTKSSHIIQVELEVKNKSESENMVNFNRNITSSLSSSHSSSSSSLIKSGSLGDEQINSEKSNFFFPSPPSYERENKMLKNELKEMTQKCMMLVEKMSEMEKKCSRLEIENMKLKERIQD